MRGFSFHRYWVATLRAATFGPRPGLQDDYPLCPCFDQVPIELVKFRILSPDAGPLPAAIGVTAAPRRAAASRRPRDPAPAAAAARPLRPTSGPPLPQCLSHREIPPRAPGPRRRGGSSSCPNGRGRGHRTRRAPRPRIRARHRPGPAGSGGDLAEEPRRPPLEDHAQDELSAPAKGRRGPACRQAPPQPAIPGPAPRPRQHPGRPAKLEHARPPTALTTPTRPETASTGHALARQAAQQITDTDINTRLHQLLTTAGHTPPEPDPGPAPARTLRPARRTPRRRRRTRQATRPARAASRRAAARRPPARPRPRTPPAPH